MDPARVHVRTRYIGPVKRGSTIPVVKVGTWATLEIYNGLARVYKTGPLRNIPAFPRIREPH